MVIKGIIHDHAAYVVRYPLIHQALLEHLLFIRNEVYQWKYRHDLGIVSVFEEINYGRIEVAINYANQR